MERKKRENGRRENVGILFSALAGTVGMVFSVCSVFVIDLNWTLLGIGIVIFGSFWIPYAVGKRNKTAYAAAGTLPVVVSWILWGKNGWEVLTNTLAGTVLSNIGCYLNGEEIVRELSVDRQDMLEFMLVFSGMVLAVCMLLGSVRKIRGILLFLYVGVFLFPFFHGLTIRPEGAVLCGVAMLMVVAASPSASVRPLAAAAAAAVCLGMMMPKGGMEKIFSDPFLWQSRMKTVFKNSDAGGVTDGKLGTVDQVTENGAEQLEVVLSERPEMRMYLQGFVGTNYWDNQWQHSRDTGILSKVDIQTVRKVEYETVKKNEKNFHYQLVTVDITRKNADGTYCYLPYKSAVSDSIYGDTYVQGKGRTYSTEALLVENVGRMKKNPENISYQESDVMRLYSEFVYDRYLQVPEPFREQWQEEMFGLQGRTLQATVRKIADYLERQAKYTKHPGRTPEGEDFVSYFLKTGKKGYCVHFASAGVLFLRMNGIPARFVSGYLARPSDFKETREKTYKAVLDDSTAHAWAEIYVEGCGWLPVEMTPAYRNETTGQTNRQEAVEQEEENRETPETIDPEEPKQEQQQHTEKGKENEQGTGNDKEVVRETGNTRMVRTVIILLAVSAGIVFLLWKRRWKMLHLRKRKKERYLFGFCLLREMMEADLKRNIPEEPDVISQILKQEYGLNEDRTGGVIRHVLETAYGNRTIRKADIREMEKLGWTVRRKISRKKKGIRKIFFFLKKGF